MESLNSNKITKQTTPSATQQFLDIAEIEEDVVVLKNGALRAILAVSAINFDLKSSDEQEAIIAQYQNFLNSLDFPIQILISSRKMNVDKYMAFVEKKEKEQTSDLLRLQTAEYKNFIHQLVSVSNIMDKNFYIIVPFAPVENTEKSFLGNLFSRNTARKDIMQKRENFETYKNQLLQRADHIEAALSGIGTRITMLRTQELIELIYNAYNPNLFMDTTIGDINNLELK